MRDEMKTAGSSIADAIAATMHDVSDDQAGRPLHAADRLIAIEEIKALKARYFRCMDTKDWDAFRRRVFAADAVVDVSGEMRADAGRRHRPRPRRDRDVRPKRDRRVTTVHHGHMPEIDVVLADARPPASGRWRTCCVARRRADPQPPRLRPLPRDLRAARRPVAIASTRSRGYASTSRCPHRLTPPAGTTG